jgi:hypothetical protein
MAAMSHNRVLAWPSELRRVQKVVIGQPTDGRIKGREVCLRSVVFFQEVMWRIRDVRLISAACGTSNFPTYTISSRDVRVHGHEC